MTISDKPAAGEPDTDKGRWWSRLGSKLEKTRDNLSRGLGDLLLGKREIDPTLLEDLETLLLSADVGVDVTEEILEQLSERIKRRELDDSRAVYRALRGLLIDIVRPRGQPLVIDTGRRPFVLMVVGVNGSGKTTTIGKLAIKLKRDGHQVALAAGDTFRAAAIEQLQGWGERADVPVVSQGPGADAAAVAHDAVRSAQSRAQDVLIVDTAGRLHTQTGLMDELKKIKRVLAKADASAPHEVLLVLDAGNGQNALVQFERFHEAVGVTGICLTKLDGTAKGGIVFALAKKAQRPIRFVGVGEGLDDLRVFDAHDFVNALVPPQ